MRILSLGNLYPPASMGGYELVWRSAVEHQRAAGHEVAVLTSDHRAGEIEPADDVHRGLRLYWADHEFPRFTWRRRLELERHNALELDAALELFDPQVVCWWALGGMSLSLIERVRRHGLPAVGVVCDDWMLYGPKVDAWTNAFRGRPRAAALAERLTGIPARLRLDEAATWLFLSETVRRRAREGGVVVSRSEICNRGPDDELFAARPEREWRGELLYIGRLDERKGVDTALAATAELEGARLTIDGSGDDDYRHRLEREVAELGLGGRVHFTLSTREQVPAAYENCDAVIFPVRWDEPWGLVPLEAMAVGRPVIATGRGGSGEYLRDRENCLLFEASDAAGLAAAVRELERDPQLRRRLREGGFETAARFSEHAFNEQIEAALERAR